MKKEPTQQFVIIPPEVMADERLTATQKILYGVIYALHNERGYCYATNTYLGTRTFTNRANTSRNIAVLTELGYLKSDIVYADSKEVEERKLYPLLLSTATPRCRKEQHPVVANDNTPVAVNDKGISKSLLVNKNRGNAHEVNQEFLSELQLKYPKLNVQLEREKAESWAAMNGRTYKDHRAFLRNWLIKSQQMWDEKHPKREEPLSHGETRAPQFVDVNYENVARIRQQVQEKAIGVWQ